MEQNPDSTKELTFSEQLKASTRETHDKVDEMVMSKEPFASKENYAKFLQAQHEFHETLRPLYLDKVLNEHIPGLSELGRADNVIQDMQDLNAQPATGVPARPQLSGIEGIGWLYCGEGSNVGAAILYRHAGKIELNDEFGASHLAAHSDGRMRHWREFKAKLDALELNEEEQQLAFKGAQEAFAYFKSVLQVVFA